MTRFVLLLGLWLPITLWAQKAPPKQPNILLITADDMNFNSVGVYGAPIGGLTPNIDRLASQGLRFENAHVTIAVCAPSRATLATGMYPHHSGVEGFYKTKKEVTSIIEILKEAGYITGVFGKENHSSPEPHTPWDVVKTRVEHLGYGRDPSKYYSEVSDFIQRSKQSDKPFYLMANAIDPHRPFSGSDQEKKAWPGIEIHPPSRTFLPSEIEVPAFLPDIPKVRQEIAEYYSSVRRADDVVGAILKALEESGEADNTLVMFLSDHGMALPFAKTNCYLNSTKTPWMVRWPGVISPNMVDREHFISGIDFMPTLLDILNIDGPTEMDGKSFKKLLLGKKQSGREYVFTQFHETSARKRYPMRAVQNGKYLYIFSPWADGKKVFKNESQHGRSFKAMQEAAKTDPYINARVDLFVHRVTEEFYDLEKDPNALNNLIDRPEYKKEVHRFSKKLEKWMKKYNDPALAAFEHRDSPEYLAAYMLKDKEIADKNRLMNNKLIH
ncbi:sulfatase family protein [Sediminicola luteus]|uniref:sulfatase family protein n=1 Tax=Sediminicola luteus TaxID=319238 RepID=UPI001551C014|nr:sulfatase [Sediminicola luteus]